MDFDILLVKLSAGNYNALQMKCTHQDNALTASKSGLCKAPTSIPDPDLDHDHDHVYERLRLRPRLATDWDTAVDARRPTDRVNFHDDRMVSDSRSLGQLSCKIIHRKWA